MTEETIVAVYDTAAQADAAVADLEAMNVPSSAITRHSGTTMASQPGTAQSGASQPVQEKGFWAKLFGDDSGHDAAAYDNSMTSSSSVVMVKVPDNHVHQVTEVLERHSPIDMDERAAAYGGGNVTTTTTTTTQGVAAPTSGVAANAATVGTDAEEVLSLSEEQLQVGKRMVNRGTTRVRRFVVETPVEEAVTLHSETVSIERRPVAAGTHVTDADFTDRTIEVTETAEEAVVAKTARVREEVVINKAATERVETVRDTVRREDVEITKDDAVTQKSTVPGTVPPRTGV